MALVSVQNVTLAFGGLRLFNGITFSLDRGEKVSLVGRNGTGKSTLLRLLSGDVQADEGTVLIQKGVRVASLLQEIPPNLKGTVLEIITGVSSGDWEKEIRADKVISQLKLDQNLVFQNLSAGLKRQVLFARALADDPDVLLLDEPTNHMDIEAIKRLEEFLLRFTGSLLFVTHDRMFLRKIANRIMEIDRGNLFDQPCDYNTFLKRKEELLHAEEMEHSLFDKKLANEERWVRQGIKARRTRNEGRVRELNKMREMRRERRERIKSVKMEVQQSGRSGRMVTEADNVSFRFGDHTVISRFSTTILRGDRIGIIGPNGIGKTTLLRIFLGTLKPSEGKIRLGTGLEISYFDQIREQLDETKSIRENVSEGKDFVTINGKDRHVVGYLKDFLFSPHQTVTPVSRLSGGERNRLLLARLFTRPSNLLVMDEPTNDLDAETLEILEEFLMHYSGTILLVSHDREFINNVVTSIIVFEGNGLVKEYIGGYDDWVSQRGEVRKKVKGKITKKNEPSPPVITKKGPLGYMQKKELKALPGKIDGCEKEQEQLFQCMSKPDFYKQEKEEITKITERLESVKKTLHDFYERWEELESGTKLI